jgi:hypothetical protein
MTLDEQAILKAEAERGDLVSECHALIVAIAYKPSCLKLLGLARNHLKMLAQYKANRTRSRL